jgi:hypothetical protein
MGSQEDPGAIRVRALQQVLATVPPPVYQSPTAAQTYASSASTDRGPLGVPATDPRLLPGFKSAAPVSEIHVESGGGDNPVLLDPPNAQNKDGTFSVMAPQLGSGMLAEGLLASQIRLESATRWLGDRAASLASSTTPAVADEAAALSSAIGESRLAANVLMAASALVMVLGGCWAHSSERFANLKRKWFVRFPRA